MKPSETEDRYVLEHELSRRLEAFATEQQEAAVAEQRRLKELHWMRCPKCGQKLAAEHHGRVEIDLCPGCRGLWLDANELETIMGSGSGFLHSCLMRVRARRPQTARAVVGSSNVGQGERPGPGT